MTLTEFIITEKIGAFQRAVQIYDIAKDKNTPEDVLEYIETNGNSIKNFVGWDFRNVARDTLNQKKL